MTTVPRGVRLPVRRSLSAKQMEPYNRTRTELRDTPAGKPPLPNGSAT
jgi:hypothetical protein